MTEERKYRAVMVGGPAAGSVYQMDILPATLMFPIFIESKAQTMQPGVTPTQTMNEAALYVKSPGKNDGRTQYYTFTRMKK